MAFVSVTRLRLRSARFVLPFVWFALRSRRQAAMSPGNFAAEARRARGAWWTLTVWTDAAAMRAFMLSGTHKQAMPHLRHWCDEASLTHWEQDDAHLPPWTEAERRLAHEGRVSAVNSPSPAQ